MVKEKKNILEYTKDVYDAFTEVNGNLKINTSSTIGRRKLSDRKMKFLEEYIRFVTESGLLSQASLIWFDSAEKNRMDAIRAYNATCGKFKQIDNKKAYNRFDYDRRKLLELFRDDMLHNVIFTSCDISSYEADLQYAISKKTKQTFLGKMTMLKLPSAINQEQPTDEEIETFFTLLGPYTKEAIQQVESMIPKNVVGYINYIANKKERSEDEQALINRLELLEKGIEIE